MIFAYLDVLLLSFTSYNLQTVNEFWIVYMLTSMRVVTHAVCQLANLFTCKPVNPFTCLLTAFNRHAKLDVMYFNVHVEGVSSIHVKKHVYVPYCTE